MDIYKSFVYMFYALDAVYDEAPSEELGNYLSGLNPFWFDYEGSADPAEYEEFKEAFVNRFNDIEPNSAEIYEFCKEYLSKNAPQKAIDAFNQYEKDEWTALFEESEK